MKTIIINTVLFMLLITSWSLSYAEGGKVKNPVIIDEDTECAMVISGIDTEKCLEVPAPDQSGINVFNCQVTIICTDK